MFAHVESYGGDPILSLMDAFHKDPNAAKVNLSIGLYYDELGRIPRLASAVEAQRQLLEGPQAACVYLPMEGLDSYRRGVQELLFGAQHSVLLAGRMRPPSTAL